MVKLCQIECEARTDGAVGPECGGVHNHAYAVARRRQAMWTDRANRHFDPGENLAGSRAQKKPLDSGTSVRANDDSLCAGLLHYFRDNLRGLSKPNSHGARYTLSGHLLRQ